MIHVVIPTFNRKDKLLQCLASLSKQTVPHQIYVCDSGSTDGTREVLDTLDNVTRLDGHDGLFWSGAINLGLEEIRHRVTQNDRILFLNDDCLFGADLLENLLKCAEAGDNRIVGSVSITCTDNLIDDGGVLINWWTGKFKVLGYGMNLKEFDRSLVRSVSVLSGRGTLFPVSVLENVGVINESRLPQYGADYEYTDRCVRRGYQLLICYSAIVENDPAASGVQQEKNVSLRSLFFSQRSSFNLRNRFWLAYLTARNPVQGMCYFVTTVARAVWGALFKAR